MDKAVSCFICRREKSLSSLVLPFQMKFSYWPLWHTSMTYWWNYSWQDKIDHFLCYCVHQTFHTDYPGIKTDSVQQEADDRRPPNTFSHYIWKTRTYSTAPVHTRTYIVSPHFHHTLPAYYSRFSLVSADKLSNNVLISAMNITFQIPHDYHTISLDAYDLEHRTSHKVLSFISWTVRILGSKEISRVLCNRNVHYRDHNSSPLPPVLSHINLLVPELFFFNFSTPCM